jgi:hypothetical protein
MVRQEKVAVSNDDICEHCSSMTEKNIRKGRRHKRHPSIRVTFLQAEPLDPEALSRAYAMLFREPKRPTQEEQTSEAESGSEEISPEVAPRPSFPALKALLSPCTMTLQFHRKRQGNPGPRS